MYNVFKYEPYEGYEHVLYNASLEELTKFLSGYKGYVDDLTIFECHESDNHSIVTGLGFKVSFGKIKKEN